jgi:hypothetical protein
MKYNNNNNNLTTYGATHLLQRLETQLIDTVNWLSGTYKLQPTLKISGL